METNISRKFIIQESGFPKHSLLSLSDCFVQKTNDSKGLTKMYNLTKKINVHF